jgi:hypothetical protein
MTVLVQRSFVIERGTGKEFERLSREGIWPYMEARGCKIVGLFANVHGGPSDELILLTAYDSLAHWESTRDEAPLPTNAGEEARRLHSAYVDALRERRKLVRVTSSRVLRPVTDKVDFGVYPW